MVREQLLAARLATLERLATALARATSHAQLARLIFGATLDAVGARSASLWEIAGQTPRLIEAMDATPEPSVSGAPVWGDEDVVLPLLAGGATIGALVYRYAAPRVHDPEERAFLLAIADHAAGALRAATTAQRLAKLQEATAALASARTPSEVARVTVQVGSEAVDASSGILWLVEADGRLHVQASHGVPAAYHDRYAVLPVDGEHGLARVMATGEPLWVETEADFAQAVPAQYEVARAAGRVAAFGALPLSHDGVAIGAVAFGYATEREISDEERRFLRALAQCCEQSLERARLYVHADAANRTKTAFLAMLGHELRNPLAPIVSALDLLRSRKQPLERELAVIDRQVRHLTGLIDDLLDISRMTRGRIDLTRSSVPLREAIDAALERTQPLIAKQRHEVTLAVAPLAVDADRSRLVQVLVNLVTNAAQYTPSGGQIAIAAQADGDQAVVSIRDTGVGIAPELLAVLFDLFSQGERSFDRAQGGLGLGLAIAKHLIERHGGTIAAHSEGVGRGAELVVRWPLAAATTDVVAPLIAIGPGPALRVLVVDDNIAAAEMLGEILRVMGHEPTVAHDSASALAHARTAAPDVALVDIGLPVVDGYELASRLRALPSLATTRLIALTGYNQDSDRERSARAGFDEHVVKPIDQAALAQLLRASNG